jgi:O-antigen ligase
MSYGIFFEIWKYKDVLPTDPSPFLGHIDYSVYLCFTLILLLSRVFRENIFLKEKIFYILSFLLVTSNLFLNGGRTGQVLFIFSLFLFLFLKIKNKLYSIIISSVLLISILFTAYNISPNFRNRSNELRHDIQSIIINNNFQGSFGQRIALWYIGSHVFLDNPIIGTGINNEVNDIQLYCDKLKIKTNNLQHFSDVHNTFIMYAMQLGIVGLILFIMIFYYALKIPLDKKYRDLNLVFLFIFIGFSNASNTFHTLDSMVFFAMFSGLFATISHLNYKEDL